SSDLNYYLSDMENSIIVDDCSEKSFRDALRKALGLKPEEKRIMQSYARRTAEKYFDYRNYIEEIRQILK
ncbi:hypothetical protein RYX56_22360, partial [Alkalihalophilus lindianensis]